MIIASDWAWRSSCALRSSSGDDWEEGVAGVEDEEEEEEETCRTGRVPPRRALSMFEHIKDDCSGDGDDAKEGQGLADASRLIMAITQQRQLCLARLTLRRGGKGADSLAFKK